MGADRGILVQVDGIVEPLAVAKILKGVVEAEQPGLVILGKQAIDDDASQTGQMLAALLNWAQGTFASKIELADGSAKVTREVDGGLQTLDAEAAGDRHHRPPAEPAALRLAAQHHEGEEEADRHEERRRLRRRHGAAPRESMETREPPKRQAGIKVASVAELVDKLKNEAGVLWNDDHSRPRRARQFAPERGDRESPVRGAKARRRCARARRRQERRRGGGGSVKARRRRQGAAGRIRRARAWPRRAARRADRRPRRFL